MTLTDDFLPYNPQSPDTTPYIESSRNILIEPKQNPSTFSTWQNPDHLTQVLNNSKGKIIIWDFDGVISDTEPTQWASYRMLLQQLGVTSPAPFPKILIGRPEFEIWEKLFDMGVPAQNINTLVEKRSKIYLEIAKASLSPSWLVKELMPIFSETAKKQYVISNGNRTTNIALLTHWDMLHFVDVVDKGTATKDELFIYHAQEQPTVIIEDTAIHARVAKENGAFVIGVLHSLSITKDIPADIIVHI